MKTKKLTSVSTPQPAGQERATYTKEFKLAAVQRVRTGQKSATELALELGVRRTQLYKWAKAVEELGSQGSFPGAGRPTSNDENELIRLRRQLAQANEEVAILKKFNAYLARQKR